MLHIRRQNTLRNQDAEREFAVTIDRIQACTHTTKKESAMTRNIGSLVAIAALAGALTIRFTGSRADRRDALD